MNDLFNIAIMIPVLHYIMGSLQIDPESLVGELPVSMVLTVSVVHNYWVVLSLVMSGNSVAAYLFQATTASGAKGGGHLAAVASHVDSGSKTEKIKPKKLGSSGDFTIEKVAKHNKKEDIWVIINRQVLK